MGGERISLIKFAQLNETLENANGSIMKINLLKRSWDSFEDKPLLIQLLSLDVIPNNIAKKKAIKWIAKAYGVYDDEIENYTSMYGDIGEGIFYFDGSSKESNVSLTQLL